MFIFLVKGQLELVTPSVQKMTIGAGTMTSLEYGVNYTGKCLSDLEFVILSFNKPQIRCDEFSMLALKKYLPDNGPNIRILPILPQIQDFLKVVCFYLEKKMYCSHLHALKQSEWFFLMKAFYTKEQNALFFQPLIEEKNSFVELVREKSQHISTVNELAEACNMTPKTLTRNFKKHFRATPKQWLLLQKKQSVKLRLLKSEDKMEKLSQDLGFSSGSHLNSYCKKFFEQTPSEIRENPS